MKKIIIIIAVILVAGCLGTWYLVSKEKYKAPEWRTAKADTGSIVVVITSTGTIEPLDTVMVGAQVTGIVKKIFVDFDSVVRKGQVIALLDTTLLYPIWLGARAAVSKARVNVELTRLQFARIDTLYQQKVESKNDYDMAYEAYKSAQADLQMAEATMENDRTNLGYATIHAPCNGTVISRSVNVGQTVVSSFNSPQLFTIGVDLTQMLDLADVDEADIGQVKDGQDAAFTVDAFPYDVFRGKVVQVRLNPINIQNVNNYIVVINAPNPERKLLPGMTATTTIRTAEHDHVFKVLANAIHFTPPADYLKHIKLPDSLVLHTQQLKIAGNEIPKSGSTCYIWLKRNNELTPVPVTLGLFDGTYIEVSGELQVGDEVVTGIGSTAASTNTTANNPFMPQMHPAANKK